MILLKADNYGAATVFEQSIGPIVETLRHTGRFEVSIRQQKGGDPRLVIWQKTGSDVFVDEVRYYVLVYRPLFGTPESVSHVWDLFRESACHYYARFRRDHPHMPARRRVELARKAAMEYIS